MSTLPPSLENSKGLCRLEYSTLLVTNCNKVNVLFIACTLGGLNITMIAHAQPRHDMEYGQAVSPVVMGLMVCSQI